MIELKVTINGKEYTEQTELPEFFDRVEGVEGTFLSLRARTLDLLWQVAHSVNKGVSSDDKNGL